MPTYRRCLWLEWMVPVLTLTMLSCAKSPAPPPEAPKPPEPKDIMDTLLELRGCIRLAEALELCDLTATLRTTGPLTLFVPQDAAFAKLPPGSWEELLTPESRDKLADLLSYHVARGRHLRSDLARADSLETLQGQSLSVDLADEVTLDGAKVVQADILCANGVIHVIDGVLIPGSE